MRRLFLLMKAEMVQLGLFDTPVHVDAHVRKDGTYVKPHTARRKKRMDTDAGARRSEKVVKVVDKEATKPADKVDNDRFERGDIVSFVQRSNGRDVEYRAKVGQPYFNGAGDDQTAYVTVVERSGRSKLRAGMSLAVRHRDLTLGHRAEPEASPKVEPVAHMGPEKKTKPEPKKVEQLADKFVPTHRPDDGANETQNRAPDQEFGVQPGTTKAERKRLNARAAELLREKKTRFTAEDLVELANYTGQGGVGDSLNEFYTPAAVASAMWQMLSNAGFAGGTVLEPCVGTGVFLHTAPAGVRATGVEIEPVSAGIATALHGARHEVFQAPFEQFARSDPRLFDAVIGNVPFGLRGALIKEDKSNLKTAEQYFVDTSIDKVKGGGLVALIVPTGVMDGKNNRAFRERLLRKAEFLGAQRMPNTAFEAAHTEVTTDIVLFRRRQPDVAGALATVDRDVLRRLGIWDEDFLSGQYYSARGAANVYGTPEPGWRAKAGMGQDITVAGSMDGVPQSLAAFRPEPVTASVTMADIMDALKDDEEAATKAVSGALRRPYEVAQPGDTKTVDGVTYVLQGDPPRWHRVGGDEEEQQSIIDAKPVAELLDTLFDWSRQAKNQDDSEGAKQHRKRLVEALDAYVKQHGNPHKNKDLMRAARDDKSLWRLVGSINADGTYSDLVTGRASSVEDLNSFDTVAQRLSIERGTFTPDDIASIWVGGDREAALDHLFASSEYAVGDDGKTWSSMDDYLSGELWPKFDAARAALEHEGLSAHYRDKYAAQIKALEGVIDPKSLEDVEVMLNSAWVPLPIIEAFWVDKQQQVGGAWSQESNAKITFEGGVYTVDGGPYQVRIFEKYLNRAGVKEDEWPLIDTWNREFKVWLTASSFRDEVEDLYNRSYRGFRQKRYSDAPLDIPGLNPALAVNSYHFAGLRWALETGKGIIGDDVGLGKTGRALMLARLSKLHGAVKKPTIVVPKAVLANWMAEIEFWFPGSSVMVIGETYSRGEDGELVSKTDTADARNRKYHELSQNEYDFVLLSQPAFNDLDVDPVTKNGYLGEDFWVQRGDALGNAGDKRVKKIRESFKQAMAQRDFKNRTDAIYFGDLGIDMLMLDEGHAYKNLYAAKSRFGGQPKFLGGQGLSNRALDTFYKSKWVREHNDGRGVFLLTATPTKNSPLEVYSMLSHVAPEAFERLGIRNSEEFLDRNCEFRVENVLGVDGDIVEHPVTVGFKNMDELRDIMRRYIDRRTAADVGLQLPDRDERQHLVEMSAAQKSVYGELRAQAAESGGKDATGDAHIFSIMDKMRKAAMDLELLDGAAHKGAVSPKYQEVAKEAAKGAKDGGQLIFVDHNESHEKIADALVRAGFKRSEIGIVNAKVAASSARRQNISDAFNAGNLKVVIGNTATMGEGMNLQKRTTDIHHMDLPWEPASMHQRNGRAVRQGNKMESVRLHSYLSKGSFDAYRYQTLMAKKDWQDQLWHGGDRIENLSREGNFSREDMLVMLSPDPDLARKQLAENKAAALERLAAGKTEHASEVFVRFQEMKRSLNGLKNKNTKAAKRLQARMEQMKANLKADEYFAAKDALDSDTPVLIQKQTGTIYTAGTAFDMDPGPEAPINWSDDKPSRWVVVGVDIDDGTVRARPYGRPSGKAYYANIDDMRRGVTPTTYSEKEEEAEMHRWAESVETDSANAAKSPTDLTALKPATIRALAPALQRQIKDAFRGYKDGWKPDHVPMIDADGKAIAVIGYDARKKLDTHDIMLPLPEHKEKAIAAYIEYENTRKLITKYHQKNRRRGSSYSETDYSRPVGIQARYNGYKDKNGWEQAGKALFGDSFLDEARAEHALQAIKHVKDAADTKAALAAAGPAINVANYGLKAEFPRDLLTAVWAKARDTGALDKPLKEVLPDSITAHVFSNGTSTRPADQALRSSLISEAVASGHTDVAAAFVIEQAKAEKWPGPKTLGELSRLRKPLGSGRGADPAFRPEVLDAMKKIVDHAKLADRTVAQVKEVGGFGYETDEVFKRQNDDRPIGEVLDELRAAA